ncbi:Ger(x)C family spore germination protein [Paenibacillus alkalitolerans]|uniref:Ger(x)C family spore germination protein n=1 Tax=Paenibacillus alkalitolerans TaxID=2799335 RepID=UPI0018F2A653|nr:Ger(x)C family spore germination protein [Paenibacillus alkalitolerans]
MRRRFVPLLFLIVSLAASGCWNRKEMNELAIINAMAVDLNDKNEWVTSFQVIIPESINAKAGGGGAQTPVMTFSTTGKTLAVSAQKARFELPRALFFPHNRVVVIGERAAKRGVRELVDAFLRDNENRETVHLLLHDGEARRVLEVLLPLEKFPGNAMDNLIEGVAERQTNIVQSRLHEFITTLANPAANATLPEIKISGDWERQKSLDALKVTRKAAALKLDRTGVFKKDKLAGWFSRNESIGLAWITNRMENTVLAFPCKERERMEELSSFMVEQAETRLKPKISDGKLFMSVDIAAKGTLIETTCKLDLTKAKNLGKLEKQIRTQIKDDVEQTFNAAKKLKADALGFGDAFHKAYPRAWKKLSKEWEQEFMEIQLDVAVKVTIRRTGMINNSASKLSGNKE